MTFPKKLKLYNCVRVCVCEFLPLSGIISLQGRAKGVIECWQTSAVKLPVKKTAYTIKITEI